MRINFFVPRCTSDNSHGRYVIELSKRFSKMHSVRVFAGAFSADIESTVECHRIPVQQRPAIARLASLWVASLIATRRWPADITHNQGADAPVGDVVTAQFCNKTIRRMSAPSGLYRRVNYALGAAVEKYCMTKRSTRKVIAVSGRVKSEIENEYGVSPANVVVIHHGVDLEAFNPELRNRWRDSVRDGLGLGRSDFVALFVGGDYRRKGLMTLLRALRRISRPIKTLAVEVVPDRALSDFVASCRLSDAVKFVGRSKEIATFYAAADCFVLPTHYDTFSMATLEAMACGVPVIVSRVAGISELLTDGRDSFVLEDAEDDAALAEQLERLIRNPEMRETLGAQGRSTAEQHSWDEVARKTASVYADILAKS
jgi:glycosyltransferase involved in cell wall biosynthesis